MKIINNLDKINSLFSKNDFEKKFPLFSKYEFEEQVKQNALDNKDLIRKYNQYNQSITTYLFELDKRFDKETIRNIIVETIFKNPDEIMMSIISSYLNSSEEVKSNASFVVFYNKTSNFGTDSIEYMQNNGIILDRTYKNIPNLAIDSKYESVKHGDEIFKGELLEDVYDNLTYPQRRYVIGLIENNSYPLLDILFGRFNFNTNTLTRTLMSKGINDELINNDVICELDAYSLMLMFCYIIEHEDTTNLVRNIIILIKSKRYDILKEIIINGYLDNLGISLQEEIENNNDLELIQLLSKKELYVKKIEEVA